MLLINLHRIDEEEGEENRVKQKPLNFILFLTKETPKIL